MGSMFKRLGDELTRYRAARLTAEALVWHHGVRRALDEAEAPQATDADHRQAVRVARLAGRSYALF